MANLFLEEHKPGPNQNNNLVETIFHRQKGAVCDRIGRQVEKS